MIRYSQNSTLGKTITSSDSLVSTEKETPNETPTEQIQDDQNGTD